MATLLKSYDFRQESKFESEYVSAVRNSEASYYASDGYLRFSSVGENLISTTPNFSRWNKVGITVSTPGNVKSPDGSGSADKITESSANGEHRFSQSLDIIKGSPVTISIYLRAGTRSGVLFSFLKSSTFTGGLPSIRFDLSSGRLISRTSNVISYEATNVGDGWWRLKVTGMPDLGSDSGMHVYVLNDNNSVSYRGDTSNYIWAWGAQIEQGTSASDLALYSGIRFNYDVSSTPRLKGVLIEPSGTNVIPYSELMTHSSWRKQYATVVASGKSPSGASSAFKIKEDRSRSAHYIVPNPSVSASDGSTYTISAFLKAAERKWAYFNINGLTVHFDLANGVIGNMNNVFTPYIENAGNGWYRCAATFVLSESSISFKIGPEQSNGQTAYSGDGDSGVLVWGAQIEKSSELTSYIRTASNRNSRSSDIVTVQKPSSGTHDVFVQRSSGGTWINKVEGDYEIAASESEVQVVNFYSGGETVTVKDNLVQTLFQQVYALVGLNNSLLSINGATYVVQTANKSWSLQRAINKSAPVYRFQVNAGDQWSGDAGNSKKKERSELYMKNANLPYDQDVWLSYSMRITDGASINLNSSEHCYLGQFHASEDREDAVSPPVFGLRFEGKDTLKAYTAATTERYHKSSPSAVLRGTATVERGVWHRIVMRVRFSPTKGQFQWWVNGREVASHTGIGIGYVDASGPYWKFGIYRSAISPSLTVEYANMEHVYGQSLYSRITSPLPIA